MGFQTRAPSCFAVLLGEPSGRGAAWGGGCLLLVRCWADGEQGEMLSPRRSGMGIGVPSRETLMSLEEI